ncbi:MAG: endonuclease [Gemmataceae bacterium]|nr:endonuclease [Gemmataceae bacterium]
MIPEPLTQALATTLADGKLSSGEKQALQELLQEFLSSEQKRGALLHALGDIAQQNLADPRDRPLVDWLLSVIRLFPVPKTVDKTRFETHFCPGEDATRRIIQLLDTTRDSADICVFTITDDRITSAILSAWKRGLKLRVITDNDKALDLGSDVHRLIDAGVPVATDREPSHMHHKFALFDNKFLATGSFNWTRGATANLENLLVTDELCLIGPFQAEFDRLWQALNQREA